jgi:hypothetical protein
MSTVGMSVRWGAGNCGVGPVSAEIVELANVERPPQPASAAIVAIASSRIAMRDPMRCASPHRSRGAEHMSIVPSPGSGLQVYVRGDER